MTVQNPTVTTKQLCELHAQITSGRITRAMLQAFLDDPNRFVVKSSAFPITVNYDLGLARLIQEAVGEKSYVNSDISSDRFKLAGKGVRELNLELAPFFDGETGEEAAERLEAEGYTLENAAELAAFFQQYPEEVRKRFYVIALGKGSRWVCRIPTDCIRVPFVCGSSDLQIFDHVRLDERQKFDSFTIVSRKKRPGSLG